jgi:hypothetical protein
MKIVMIQHYESRQLPREDVCRVSYRLNGLVRVQVSQCKVLLVSVAPGPDRAPSDSGHSQNPSALVNAGVTVLVSTHTKVLGAMVHPVVGSRQGRLVIQKNMLVEQNKGVLGNLAFTIVLRISSCGSITCSESLWQRFTCTS